MYIKTRSCLVILKKWYSDFLFTLIMIHKSFIYVQFSKKKGPMYNMAYKAIISQKKKKKR